MISDLGWESRTKMSKDQSCINVQDCKQSCWYTINITYTSRCKN
jgi:hypothetical protein